MTSGKEKASQDKEEGKKAIAMTKSDELNEEKEAITNWVTQSLQQMRLWWSLTRPNHSNAI